MRWELRPRLFLRTSEFLWQEGHTAHATYEDAAAYAERILHEVYADFMVNVLAIPIVKGRKTTRERFPGAINTMACEAMMRDGKALQMGTSHELGQNFARAFEIQHLDAGGQQQLCWTTSWGSSTRMVGGLIMCHGDDAGLRVPPRLAPTQVVVVLVKDDGGAGAAAEALVKELDAAGVRVELDARVDVSFGRRSVDWELKGVPVRLEVGPRDLAEGVVTVVRRDLGTKESVPLGSVALDAPALLESIQSDMLAAATAERDARTHEVGHRGRGRGGLGRRVGGHGLGRPAGLRRRGPAARAGHHRALPGGRRRLAAGQRGRPGQRRLRRPGLLAGPEHPTGSGSFRRGPRQSPGRGQNVSRFATRAGARLVRSLVVYGEGVGGFRPRLLCEGGAVQVSVSDRVRDLVAPICTDLGLELYDVEHTGGKVRVTRRRPGGSTSRPSPSPPG